MRAPRGGHRGEGTLCSPSTQRVLLPHGAISPQALPVLLLQPTHPQIICVGPTAMCVWLELIPRQEPATGTGWGQGHGSWSGRGRVTPRHSIRQPPSSPFNYQRFPRFSSSQASACSLLPALLELLRVLLLSGNATAAQSPSLRDEQHLTLSLTLVPGWHRGRSCSATASSPCPSVLAAGDGYELPFPSHWQLSSCLLSPSAGTPNLWGPAQRQAQ